MIATPLIAGWTRSLEHGPGQNEFGKSEGSARGTGREAAQTASSGGGGGSTSEEQECDIG